MKVVIALLCACAVASARLAYQFPDGFLEVLGGNPQEVFTCADRPYGYYADVANGCRIFHVCEPLVSEEGAALGSAQYSFFCGNQTVFSQESLTCAHPEDSFPCEEAESLYQSSNANFGKIPEDKE